MGQPKILITGAYGQIGSVLSRALCEKYGCQQVVLSDIREPEQTPDSPFEILDVKDRNAMERIVRAHGVTQIYHLAAMLSAKGEQNPFRAWDLNMVGLLHVLELGREVNLDRIFFPSSIAVFGPKSGMEQVAQYAFLDPTTVYGISKVSGELWCQYYYEHYGLDVRSLRYPGIIGPDSLPGGGTTDYAVDIYHQALKSGSFECFLNAASTLPMVYMADAIRGTLQLMEAPAEQLRVRQSYNLSGISFNPAEIAASIQQRLPDFEITYAPDFRQAIADSWPNTIDDGYAREDWGWNPRYDLHRMTDDMLQRLQKKYANDSASVRY